MKSSSLSSLLANRMFVVQVRADAKVEDGAFRGRVDHMVSMRTKRFQSLEELEMILDAMKEFGVAYQQLASQPLTPEMLAALTNFYTQDFR
jgi:hypothetical protein